jgi:hypothetical protein
MRKLTRLSIIALLAVAAFVVVAPQEAQARGYYRYGRPYAAYYGVYARPVRVNYYRPYPRKVYRAYYPAVPQVHYRPSYGYGGYGYGGYGYGGYGYGGYGCY